MFFKTFFKIVISLTLIALILGLTFFYRFLTTPLAIDEEGFTLHLKSGESLHDLSRVLNQQGLLQYPLAFKAYARLTGVDRKLKAGEYQLSSSYNLLSVFELIEQGKVLQRSFTIVEGWAYQALFQALKKQNEIIWDFDEASFLGAMDIAAFGASAPHLEGMFFSDTYFYSSGVSASNILEQSHQTLLTVLNEEWQQRSKDLPFDNAYEALILASIVEKETGLASERPLIAGVFVNRLRKNMRLQTDPTVIYGIGEAYNGNITRKHLRDYTPYNTYRISGLPPTPIALVGREAIHAVMHPENTDFLFFVAKGDGSHYFSITLAEHEKAVKRYQFKRVNNYRSSPTKN